LAYSDFRKIVIQPVGGGAQFELKKQGAFVRYLTWSPDSKQLITYELGGKGRTWYIYNIDNKAANPLWPEIESFKGLSVGEIEADEVKRAQFREFTWSPDGQRVAGIALTGSKRQLWVLDENGANAEIWAEEDFLESISWNPAKQTLAGVIKRNGERHIDLDLKNNNGEDVLKLDVYGSISFSPDGSLLYYSKSNSRGTLDIWEYQLETKKSRQLTSFSKDTYEPVTTSDGSLLFKLKDYRVFIAMAAGDGGPSQAVNAFQSEIPFWHPDGKLLSFTYGTWRRIMDDAKYPDIQQHLGVVDVSKSLPAVKPDFVVRSSYSEDQGMCWSPNKKWIAFHTHADGTDDIWVMPVDDVKKGMPVSKGGDETGWPRWSPNGKWIAYIAAKKNDHISKLYVMGVDQETGKLTKKQEELIPPGLEEGAFNDCFWTKDSKKLVVEYIVNENKKEIHEVPIDGSQGRKIHAWESDQLYSGISVSNDQQWVAFVQPDEKGRFQIFKIPFSGLGEILQITSDDTDKAHPAFSPTENKIAFTSFIYQAIFWKL